MTGFNTLIGQLQYNTAERIKQETWYIVTERPQESNVCICHVSDLWPLLQIWGHMPVNWAVTAVDSSMVDWWRRVNFPSIPTTVVARVISNKTRDVNFVHIQSTQRAMLSFDLALVPGHQLFLTRGILETRFFQRLIGTCQTRLLLFFPVKSNTWATELEGTAPCSSQSI